MHAVNLSFLSPVFLGIVVGLVLALSGAGGGIIAVPLLIFFLDLSIQQAAPAGLVAVGLAAGAGAFMAFRENRLRYRAAGLMGSFGVISAPIGVYVAKRLNSEPLMFSFALILTWLAFKTVREAKSSTLTCAQENASIPCQVNPQTGRFNWNRPCRVALALTGTVSGFLSGLLGVGGGFVILPTLNRYSDLNTQSAVATSLGVIAFVALSGITAAALQGSINGGITIPFAIGSLIGMFIGKKVSSRIDSKYLQKSFALVCMFAAFWLFFQAFGIRVFH